VTDQPDYEAALRVGLLAKLDEQFAFKALYAHLPRWARARRLARNRRALLKSKRHAVATANRIIATVAVRRRTPWGA
jgi:hypothetical protein